MTKIKNTSPSALFHLRLATISPTALFPLPIIPTRYRLDPFSLGPRSLAGSIFMPSSEVFPPSVFLKGFSTPWSNASTGSSHSKPPAFSKNVGDFCKSCPGTNEATGYNAPMAVASTKRTHFVVNIVFDVIVVREMLFSQTPQVRKCLMEANGHRKQKKKRTPRRQRFVSVESRNRGVFADAWRQSVTTLEIGTTGNEGARNRRGCRLDSYCVLL
jgi:hypothetical protein